MRAGQYDKEFRENIIRLRIENQRTIKSLSKEYGVSASTIARWLIEDRNNKIRRERMNSLSQKKDVYSA